MDVLNSRVLIRPVDRAVSRQFYRDVLGLAIYREFGDPADPELVFFAGSGLIELSGQASGRANGDIRLLLQVRDVAAEHARLSSLGVPINRVPVLEPWGLIEMWIEDPSGVPIVLVEIPPDHPIRRDQRPGKSAR